MNKTSTLSSPPPKKSGHSRQAKWLEDRAVFPIYLALAKQLDIEIPIAADKRNLPEKPDLELYDEVESWLEEMDQRVVVHELRHLLQMTTLNANENSLCALIHRHLKKSTKTTVDRDKIDFLLVQYFALCAPAKIYHKQIEPNDVAQVMKPVLGDVAASALAWCEPLEKMIETLRGFRSLRDILKTNFIEQGRKVKETAGGMFYDPAALLMFIRFNFLLRRTFIELMHADLIAIRAGLAQLEAAGVQLMDCHNFGLSSAEPLSKIREIADDWKQPFQQEYTERTVNQTFEKLLGLRSDVEQALEKIAAKAADTAVQVAKIATPRANTEPRGSGRNAPAPNATPAAAEKTANGAAGKASASGSLEFDVCLEKIWEQLIATPPTRGRSMTTVKIGGARILMSSWEVTAFVSEDGPAAEDLRRAVVARAMVTAAVEAAKETGNATSLDKALSVARIEVSRLQERVDVAKQAKDTEAAVNLGISTKRLLSALDDAEKL
ncbi:MAG TPA: hypothetical protein VE077_17420 [Candidatus Methylomirabilis sp.]|nr:hypothetical protein [Candidatus Methylomirabilis sp.]